MIKKKQFYESCSACDLKLLKIDSNLSASKYDEGASHIYNPKCWLTPFIADFKALFTTELSVSTLDYLMASVWLSMII